MKCKNCNSEDVRIIDNEGLEQPDKAQGRIDSEIYATIKCDACMCKSRIVGDILWRGDSLLPSDMGLTISNIINQDGDIATDGEVIDQIVKYLESQGLYTERILTDKQKEVVAFNTQNTKRKDCVIFFWQDKSGRGESCQMTLRAVLEYGRGCTSYDGKKLTKWAKTADVGDVWENESSSYRRIS